MSTRITRRQAQAAIVRLTGQDALHGNPNIDRANQHNIQLPAIPAIPTEEEIMRLIRYGFPQEPRPRTSTEGVTPPSKLRIVETSNTKYNRIRGGKNQMKFSIHRNQHERFLLMIRVSDGTRPQGFVLPNSLYKVLHTHIQEWYFISDFFGFDWREECFSVGQCREAWCSFHGVLRILSIEHIAAFVSVPWPSNVLGNNPNRNFNMPAVQPPAQGHRNYDRNHDGNVAAIAMPFMVPGWH